MKMKIMTSFEWDQMYCLAGGNDAKIHWRGMYSWVNDQVERTGRDASRQSAYGYDARHLWNRIDKSLRTVNCGFRPTIEGLNAASLPAGSKDGDIIVVGTLYMNGKPVRVPKNPRFDGDVQSYIPGTKLVMREPLNDPAYQVTGILAVDKVYCDRNLLKDISYDDIENALLPDICKFQDMGSTRFLSWNNVDTLASYWAGKYFGPHVTAAVERVEYEYVDILLNNLARDDFPAFEKLYKQYSDGPDADEDFEPDMLGIRLPDSVAMAVFGQALRFIGLANVGTVVATANGVFFMTGEPDGDREDYRDSISKEELWAQTE